MSLASVGVVMSCASCQAPPPPPPSPQSDVVVTFPNATSGDRPLLLYSGMRQGVCRQFEPYVGTPSITLSLVSWNSTCPVELDVFAPYFGAFGRVLAENALADVDWFQTALSTASLSIPLPELVPVPVAVWLVAKSVDRPKAQAAYDRELSNAQPILADWGAGFTIANTSGTVSPTGFTPACSSSVAISSRPSGYDPAAINVYLVEYVNGSITGYAEDCWIWQHPEIVFVSWGNSDTPDDALAHELGHVLGLTIPTDPTIGGHTDFVSGFDDYNLMVSGADGYKNISVGQLYGMNFGSRSWLNRPAAGPKAVSRTCQDSWGPGGPGECPALTFFQPGWPVP
jgi:hypothetical protein